MIVILQDDRGLFHGGADLVQALHGRRSDRVQADEVVCAWERCTERAARSLWPRFKLGVGWVVLEHTDGRHGRCRWLWPDYNSPTPL